MKFFVLILSVFTLVACNQIAETRPEAKRAAIQFQVRDFKYVEHNLTATGTLLSNNENMRKGTYMVYIYVKNKNTDDQQILQVLLEDGVGKIEVFAGGIKSTADLALSFKGYAKLETGILSIE